MESDGRRPSFTTRLSLHEVQGMPAVLRLRNSSSSLLSSSQGSEDEQEPCHHRHRYHYVWVVVKRMKCVRGTVAYRAVGRELQATAAERAQGRWPGLEF